jgi:hypothetical protein
VSAQVSLPILSTVKDAENIDRAILIAYQPIDNDVRQSHDDQFMRAENRTMRSQIWKIEQPIDRLANASDDASRRLGISLVDIVANVIELPPRATAET